MSLFTIYLLLGLVFSAVMVMYIFTSNRMPKKYYYWCFAFPLHTFVVISCCIICAAVVYYIEHKERIEKEKQL